MCADKAQKSTLGSNGLIMLKRTYWAQMGWVKNGSFKIKNSYLNSKENEGKNGREPYGNCVWEKVSLIGSLWGFKMISQISP